MWVNDVTIKEDGKGIKVRVLDRIRKALSFKQDKERYEFNKGERRSRENG